jgi:hypothetical protein
MTKQTPRHKTSDVPTVPSQLRFGGAPPIATSTGTSTTAAQKSRFDTTGDHFEGVELSLTEKSLPVGDEEAQLHKMPGLPLRDA